jgi:hypothetical protein
MMSLLMVPIAKWNESFDQSRAVIGVEMLMIFFLSIPEDDHNLTDPFCPEETKD